MKKLSNEEYKLKIGNIKLIGIYINSHTKILHKCICGNEWEVSPSSVLKGSTCGCKSKKTHIEYLEELNVCNIMVKPIEKYISSKIKILHECICSNKWNVSPSSVLNNHLCGCKITGPKRLNYINELNVKNIKVIPLEPYQSANTKILHKCICGKEWKARPSKIIMGQLCGCKRVKNNADYIKELEKRNILVEPLSTYKKSSTKILHKCICGNVWQVTPQRVLKGVFCGCTKAYSLRGVEFYKNKKTILYYIKIKGLNNEDLYKIGVTLYKESIEKSLKKRFYRQEYEIIQTDIFEDGSEAFTLEQQIIKFNREYRYLGEKVLSSGNTELFIKDIIKS